jgi:hypothetical protein
MNERIKELAEQAGIDFFNSTDPEYFGRVYCEGWTEQQQKFAELIVQECAAHLHRRGVEGFGILEERNLKEHFGVES